MQKETDEEIWRTAGKCLNKAANAFYDAQEKLTKDYTEEEFNVFWNAVKEQTSRLKDWLL